MLQALTLYTGTHMSNLRGVPKIFFELLHMKGTSQEKSQMSEGQARS